MQLQRRHREAHKSHRAGWLRAAVLGANDGTISVASLVVGVASMAAGEYVSVQSQADTQKADLAKEAAELICDPEGELGISETLRARPQRPAI